MSRLPIRARLTAAFALAMVLVLASAAVFVYVRLESNLNESVDTGLHTRAADATALLERAGASLSGGGSRFEPEESLTQLLTPQGRLVDATRGDPDPALEPGEIASLEDEPRFFERRVPGVEGTARLLAQRVDAGGERRILVVGVSLQDRDEALSGVFSSFLIGGGVAVLIASAIGWLLASAGMRPIEAMRRRAEKVSLGQGEERLPLPEARDEVHRLGETLNEMLARLQESFERERRFVADASHELRTPLAVLKTELEGALRRGGHDPEVREALAAAAEEADQLTHLAEDMLLMARAADGPLPARREHVRVDELLERAAQRFADRSAEQGRAIRVEAPSYLAADLDPLRARQALGNLIDNALRHGAGDIDLEARASDGALEIDVSDQGSGFPPGLASRAFERFARGDAARTRGGAGLGLAIVAAIAEAHDGAASIAASGGGRTTVRVRLPLHASQVDLSNGS